MKNFLEKLHGLRPNDLPEIEGTKISKGCLRRITAQTRRKITADQKQDSRGKIYLRKALSIAATAAMITLMSTAVFAYRQEIYTSLAETGRTIKEFFTREEEMIDSKAEIINETVKESGISLTVEKAVRDGDQTYLCITLDNHDGMFYGDILTCEEFTLYRKADYPGAIMPKNGYSISTHKKLGITGVYAGDIFALLREQPTNHVKLMIPVNIGSEGSYRFTIDRLLAVSDEVDSEGYTGNLLREVIAEELTVDFTIDSELETLERTVINCDSEFEVSGVTLQLDSITVSPLEIVVDIRDILEQTIEIEGWHTEALDCLHLYSFLYDVIKADPSVTAEEAKEIYKRILPEDCYDVKIEFTDENLLIDEAHSYPSWHYSWDPGLFRQTFKTVTPVCPDEISRIYLENQNDSDDVIIIWEK